MRLYPKQYVISSQHKIYAENAKIYEWQGLSIAICKDDIEKLVIGDNYVFFGETFDFENPKLLNDQVVRSINFSLPLQSIIKQIDKWTGYFILLIKLNDRFILLNDASSQLECYFTHDSSEINLAEQPHLLYKLLGEKYSIVSADVPLNVLNNRRNIFYKTIYQRISKLIPNHFYDFQNKQLIRFYPFQKIEKKDTSYCISEIIRILENTMISLIHRKTLVSALTSGWDSRILLACNKKNIDKIDFFTIDKIHSYSDIDVKIAKEILHRLGKRLNIFEFNKYLSNHFPQEAIFVSDYNSEIITDNFYRPHFKDKYLINGNISEVGRFYYRPLPKKLSPKDLAYIVKCEQDKYHLDIFKTWQDDFAPFKKMGYDELDFLYWEHRISNWLGSLKTIYNIHTTVISPFNNRYLLDTLFSMDKKYRDSRFPKYYKIILQKLVPELNNIPVNPMESIQKIKISKALRVYPITKALRLKFRKLH